MIGCSDSLGYEVLHALNAPLRSYSFIYCLDPVVKLTPSSLNVADMPRVKPISVKNLNELASALKAKVSAESWLEFFWMEEDINQPSATRMFFLSFSNSIPFL